MSIDDLLVLGVDLVNVGDGLLILVVFFKFVVCCGGLFIQVVSFSVSDGMALLQADLSQDLQNIKIISIYKLILSATLWCLNLLISFN